MRDRLSIKASMLLPETLADCYSLSHFDQKLKGILLSKFGIFQRAHDDDENDDTHIYIPANPGVVSSRGRSRNEPLYGCFCDECLPVIMEPVKKKRVKKQKPRMKTKSSNDNSSDNGADIALDYDDETKANGDDSDGFSDNEAAFDEAVENMDTAGDDQENATPEYRYTNDPPINAIANGNFIGHLPKEFEDLSRSEEAAVALMIVCIYLSTIVSSKMTVVNSHHYIIKNPDPMIRNVPASVSGTVRVAMVGAFTSENEAMVSFIIFNFIITREPF